MSRLWDTPDYWARSEADEMLREMADMEPGAVADAFERSSANYDGDREMATAIIAELRRRADAGIRFWTAPQPVARVEIDDDEIPW
jgi:hypothetical protein